MSDVELNEGREDAKRRVREVAFDEGRECEHCDGTGQVPGGRQLVHSMAGFLGADDWEAEMICLGIDEAEQVRWIQHSLRHDLEVTSKAGRTVHFDVPGPQRAEGGHAHAPW